MFILNDKYYTDLQKFINDIQNFDLYTVYKYKVGYIYNVPCAFDIETSSFIDSNSEKTAIMYIWQFCFNGLVLIGRTWDEFIKLCDALMNLLQLDDDKILKVYVHNLSYEFQFMRKHFNWLNVFAVDERKPIKALTTKGIEFCDSYILSGYNLAKTGEQLHKYHVNKLVGYLNYDEVRTPLTCLTDDEIRYCINDVLVVTAYIQEQIEQYGDISKIPLTNTGRVRQYCKNACYHGFTSDKNVSRETKQKFTKYIHNLTLEPDEYRLLKRAFMGGFTHANANHVNVMLSKLKSKDFTSSYPAVMLLEQYPVGKGFKIEIESLEQYEMLCKKFCLVFDMELTGISQKVFADNPISVSKCWKKDGVIENNGRVAYADYIVTSGTNIDLEIYRKFYNIEHCKIFNCYAYIKGYLPKNFLLSILKLYNDKTQLKGVEGKEVEYLHSKGMLNSCYGMMVTDIVKDESIYDTDWKTESVNIDDCIEKYNKSKSRFLFYPDGVFVTAYARRNLFTAILNCGNDYVYSDTDSVKILNSEKHDDYFNQYNQMIEQKIKLCCQVNNIDESLFHPKTIKGVVKTIGIWDDDGNYKYFKTLGAKRYIYTDESDKLHVTIAGTGKHPCEKYLTETYKTTDKIYKVFNDGLLIPSEHTGKLTHTYIDDERAGTIIDIDGNVYNYDELSGIHLSKATFEMSLSKQFIDFLRGVKTYEY